MVHHFNTLSFSFSLSLFSSHTALVLRLYLIVSASPLSSGRTRQQLCIIPHVFGSSRSGDGLRSPLSSKPLKFLPRSVQHAVFLFNVPFLFPALKIVVFFGTNKHFHCLFDLGINELLKRKFNLMILCPYSGSQMLFTYQRFSKNILLCSVQE